MSHRTTRQQRAPRPAEMFLYDLVGQDATPVCNVDETIADVATSAHLAIRRDDRRGYKSPRPRSAHARRGAGLGGRRQRRRAPGCRGAPESHAGDDRARGLSRRRPADDGRARTPTPLRSPTTERPTAAAGAGYAPGLAPLFGDHPTGLLRETRAATGTEELRGLNHRARAFVLEHLAAPPSVDWLARFSYIVDAAMLTRVVDLVGADRRSASWCFGGASGRGESLTMLAPTLSGGVRGRRARRSPLARPHRRYTRRAARVRLPAAPRPAIRGRILRGERERLEGALPRLGPRPRAAAGRTARAPSSTCDPCAAASRCGTNVNGGRS